MREIVKRMQCAELAYTLTIIRRTLPFLRRFNGQRLGPGQWYFVRHYVKTHVLVAETSASIGPGKGPPCGCSLLSFFPKLIDVFDSQCHLLVCLFAFGGLFLILTGETENSPPVVFFCFFYLGDSYSKKWSFASPFKRVQFTCQAFNIVIFCDLRFARRFAFRLDLDSPKWDLKVLRTNGKVTFAFFHLFFSGGDFSHVPSNIETSPRGKWALGSKLSLKR